MIKVLFVIIGRIFPMRNRFLPINSTVPKLTGFKDIDMKRLQTRLVPLLVITVLISGIISLTSVYADEDGESS